MNGHPEIRENLKLEHQFRKVQTVGWWLLGLFLLSSALGLFGNSPISIHEVQSRNGKLTVKYDTFSRDEGNEEIDIMVRGIDTKDGKFRLLVDESYIRSFEVEQIVPRPEHIETLGDKVAFDFLVGKDVKNIRISMDVRPRVVGVEKGKVMTEDGESAELWQFIYP